MCCFIISTKNNQPPTSVITFFGVGPEGQKSNNQYGEGADDQSHGKPETIVAATTLGYGISAASRDNP
jgi:hypothetical protein